MATDPKSPDSQLELSFGLSTKTKEFLTKLAELALRESPLSVVDDLVTSIDAKYDALSEDDKAQATKVVCRLRSIYEFGFSNGPLPEEVLVHNTSGHIFSGWGLPK